MSILLYVSVIWYMLDSKWRASCGICCMLSIIMFIKKLQYFYILFHSIQHFMYYLNVNVNIENDRRQNICEKFNKIKFCQTDVGQCQNPDPVPIRRIVSSAFYNAEYHNYIKKTYHRPLMCPDCDTIRRLARFHFEKKNMHLSERANRLRFIRLFVRLFVCRFVHSFVRSCVRLIVRWFVCSFVRGFVGSSFSSVWSFIRSFVYFSLR